MGSRHLGIIILLGFSLLGAIAFSVTKNIKAPSSSEKKDFKRIVSLAPSMSEVLVALGQAHRVVGVTIHCDNPHLAHAEKIGSFADPNFEAILRQNPDLVVAVPHTMAKSTLEHLKAYGIDVFAHQPDSLFDIKYINELIAKKLGIEQKGHALNAAIDEAIDNAKTTFGHGPKEQEPATMLMVVFASPLVVAGKHTFSSQIVES